MIRTFLDSRCKLWLDRLALAWIVSAPLVVLLCLPARAQPPEPGNGRLVVRGSGQELPLLAYEVEIDVAGVMVHGRVTQAFENPTGETIEALYVLPLPERAAVHRMELRIGPRVIRSVVQEKEQAKRTYEQARSEGKKTALVEQERANLFKTSVANVNPGERVEVVIDYVEELRFDDGAYRLSFPMTYTRRFDGGGGTPLSFTQAFTRAAAPQVTLSVRIAGAAAFDAPRSPSHTLSERWDGNDLVVTPGGPVPADRDFRLEWWPLARSQPEAVGLVERRDDGDYAVVMVVPPATHGTHGLPVETLFVIDVSGSMAGDSIRQAREALAAALERLRPGDRFNVIAFNDGSRLFREGFVDAHGAGYEQALAWVRGLEAGGGTAIHPALTRGLRLLQQGNTDLVQRMIFLTDGAVSDEQHLLGEVRRAPAGIRIHTIGIGHAPNRELMRRMAEYGRGLCQFIATVDAADNEIARFLERIDRPVLTAVRIEQGGDELYPAALPDLHLGEPLVASMRFEPGEAPAQVTVAARSESGDVSIAVPLAETAPETGLAIRWARAKVHEWMCALMDGEKEAVVRPQVIDLAQRFELATRYTSFVAVEEIPSATGEPKLVRVANGAPHGSLGAGGTWRPLLVLLGTVAGLIGILLLGLGWKP